MEIWEVERTEDLKGMRVSVVLNIHEPCRGTQLTVYEGTVNGVGLNGRFLFLTHAEIIGVTQGADMAIGVDLLNPSLVRIVVLREALSNGR